MSETDAHLVERVLAGDRNAFDSLVTTHLDRARAVARSVLGMDPAVDDVVQDAFLLAYRRLGELTEPGYFPSWLRTIVHNQAVTWLRRNSKRRHLPLAAIEEFSSAPNDPSQDREEIDLALKKMGACMEDLRPAYREVLHLRYQANLNYDTIAETLGISTVNVEKRLYRARQALLKAMGG